MKITEYIKSPVSEPIKNCVSCAHRNGNFTWGRCLLSGYYCEIERKFPTRCGENFEGWIQRPPFLQRVISIFKV